MRSPVLIVGCALVIGIGPRPAAAAECCDPAVGPTCAVCRPKWEDKKTKKPRYSQQCAEECVRGRDAWCGDHGCCAEKTSPCGRIVTRKKLLKTEEEKVDRILKYEVVQVPVAGCEPPPCRDCAPAWYDLRGLLHRCLGCLGL